MYLSHESLRPKLETIGNELLPVIAYGDALGLPVEKATSEQIRQRYGRVTRLIDITQNPFIGEYPAGMWSDDTQLSLAVALSLINADGFNMEAIAEAHIDALKSSPMGWGGSTQKSVERLMAGIHWRESGNKQGEGNGILMKMAPLIYWQVARDVDIWERHRQVELLTRMTHNNDLSVVTALVHADVLEALALRVDSDSEGRGFPFILRRAAEKASRYEHLYPEAGNKTSRILGAMALDGGGLNSGKIAMYCPGGGFHSPETLGMVYGYLSINPAYPEVMFEVVNAGGDTDSTASIAGAAALFTQGSVELPQDADMLKDNAYLEDVSRKLTRVALQM